MAGFGKFTFVGEHYSNSIVNVFYYRSTEWLPNQGNPFDDVQAILAAVVTKLMTAYLGMHDANYTCLRAEAIGYADDFRIITSSPLIQTINQAGTLPASQSTGSFISANVGLRCGEQISITGITKTKRNRGYLSIGPMIEDGVDSYGHLVSAVVTTLNTFAQLVDDGITVVAPAVTLTPVRIHRHPIKVLGQTVSSDVSYSDIRGYTLPRRASVRRSRMGEA
jgi:hypothetical protein